MNEPVYKSKGAHIAKTAVGGGLLVWAIEFLLAIFWLVIDIAIIKGLCSMPIDELLASFGVEATEEELSIIYQVLSCINASTFSYIFSIFVCFAGLVSCAIVGGILLGKGIKGLKQVNKENEEIKNAWIARQNGEANNDAEPVVVSEQ